MCLCKLLLVGIAIAVLWLLRPGAKTQFSLPSGMPYMDGVAQMHRETERTQTIILEWARLRMADIDQSELAQAKPR
jgi:hypothetical protein